MSDTVKYNDYNGDHDTEININPHNNYGYRFNPIFVLSSEARHHLSFVFVFFITPLMTAHEIQIACFQFKNVEL